MTTKITMTNWKIYEGEPLQNNKIHFEYLLSLAQESVFIVYS